MIVNLKTPGYSLIELVLAVGISSIIVLASGRLMVDLLTGTKKAEVATSIMNDLSVASKFIDRDFGAAGINLNTLEVPDINNRNFFSYMPYSPSAQVNVHEERKLILSLNTKKYPNAKQELVFLVTDRNWSIPLMFSPRKAYLVGGSCIEGNSLTFNGDCLFTHNILHEAEAEYGSNALATTTDAHYLFQLPEYFSPTGDPTRLISYSFMAAPNAHTQSTVTVNNIGVSNVASSSSTAAQSNRHTTMTSLHPSGFQPTTLDEYLKKIPFYAGEGTSFNVSKVRLIKYLIEARKVAGQDSTGLYRIELKLTSSNQFQAKSSMLLAEGFDALVLTRKYISDPIVNVTFDRQFKLTGSLKGEL